MEVCSEALMRGRVRNINYDVAILTNITSEHLNIHGSLENYIADKCKLFSQTKKTGFCILNKDDEHFKQALAASNGQVLTYGEGTDNDLYFKDVTLIPGKNIFNIVYKNQEYHIESNYPGLFNIYNLCAAILTLFALGYTFDDIKDKIESIKVSGRLELIDRGQDFYAMVDYAHTPNGITKLLEYVRLLPVKRSIVVIGQAGERDPYKRKDVGRIVATNCDHAIFTYEDPRSEDPKDIIDMMTEQIKNLDNYEIVIDRHEAIKRAINLAQPGDIVMVLGKGNETYQKLKDKTIYFNDIEEVRNAIDERLKTKQTV
jgi:UDP-N-acetylmuramyl-tripeptide synthetase